MAEKVVDSYKRSFRTVELFLKLEQKIQSLEKARRMRSIIFFFSRSIKATRGGS